MLLWAGRLLLGMLQSRFGRQKLRMVVARLNADDLATLAELVAAGRVTVPIDRRYSLGETAAAIAYVKEGRAHGKVIVTMEPKDDRP